MYLCHRRYCLTDIIYERKEKKKRQRKNLNKWILQTTLIMIFHKIYYLKIIIISDIQTNKDIKPFKKDNNPYVDGEQLTLSFILNLLDGILETPGRILMVTTNHIEKLDKAFIRPG